MYKYVFMMGYYGRAMPGDISHEYWAYNLLPFPARYRHIV